MPAYKPAPTPEAREVTVNTSTPAFVAASESLPSELRPLLVEFARDSIFVAVSLGHAPWRDWRALAGLIRMGWRPLKGQS